MSDGYDVQDGVSLLRTMEHHRLCVQAAVQRIVHALERRALVHDESKYRTDEFAGFARINRVAREHPYGSEKYKASLKSEKPTIEIHYRRNPHHPESFGFTEAAGTARGMGLLDIIECVCDWHGAWTVYDGQRLPEQRVSWMENVAKQRERFYLSGIWSDFQWHVAREVALLLENGDVR